MTITIRGLVLREVNYGENAKILTVLTAERGKISVFCHGARSVKSRHLVYTQLLCYAEYVLYQKGDSYTLREGALIESFFAIGSDIKAIALSQYFCVVALEVCSEESDESEMIRLMLNTLHVLAQHSKDLSLVKATFELTCACICGFTPDLSQCASCGATDLAAALFYLMVYDGCIICGKCCAKQADLPVSSLSEPYAHLSQSLQLSPAILTAMRYVVSAPIKRTYSFTLGQDQCTELGNICEKYLLTHLDRQSFVALDFYNGIL